MARRPQSRAHPAPKKPLGAVGALSGAPADRGPDSVDFLRDLLDLARDLAAAEKAEDTSGAVGQDLLSDA